MVVEPKKKHNHELQFRFLQWKFWGDQNNANAHSVHRKDREEGRVPSTCLFLVDVAVVAVVLVVVVVVVVLAVVVAAAAGGGGGGGAVVVAVSAVVATVVVVLDFVSNNLKGKFVFQIIFTIPHTFETSGLCGHFCPCTILLIDTAPRTPTRTPPFTKTPPYLPSHCAQTKIPDGSLEDHLGECPQHRL